jgi:hypothetical protein
MYTRFGNYGVNRLCLFLWRKLPGGAMCITRAFGTGSKYSRRITARRRPLHYNMMLYSMRRARRSAALHQYDVCKKILQEELWIEPGSPIENFHCAIRVRIAARES